MAVSVVQLFFVDDKIDRGDGDNRRAALFSQIRRL